MVTSADSRHCGRRIGDSFAPVTRKPGGFAGVEVDAIGTTQLDIRAQTRAVIENIRVAERNPAQSWPLSRLLEDSIHYADAGVPATASQEANTRARAGAR